MTAQLPKAYAWLEHEPAPRLLKEALKTFGTQEAKGSADNPTILWWAKSIGLKASYRHDSVPWCGLTVAYWAAQAGWPHAPRGNALWARNWLAWEDPAPVPMLGDVLVFARGYSGHVGLYVGEDRDAFHVLGGNQGDRVSIKRIARSRLLGARRCHWNINQPAGVRPVQMTATGPLSANEA